MTGSNEPANPDAAAPLLLTDARLPGHADRVDVHLEGASIASITPAGATAAAFPTCDDSTSTVAG